MRPNVLSRYSRCSPCVFLCQSVRRARVSVFAPAEYFTVGCGIDCASSTIPLIPWTRLQKNFSPYSRLDFRRQYLPGGDRLSRMPPLHTSCDPKAKGYLEVAGFQTTAYLEVGEFHVPPLQTSCDPNTIGYLEVAGFHVPPLHTSCDPNTKLTIEYLEVGECHVPPLQTSCDSDTKLGLRESWSLQKKFEFLTGDNGIPGGYLELAGFYVPPLYTSCDPNTKLGLRESWSL
uniref:Uncharacterized protein n=1 Tax=Vespula pensylvanica TaxID=30213 RepID=A0A834U8Y2_VESPE|nr:hypothetical protein H0235_008485 [Vespula pensylvanica]